MADEDVYELHVCEGGRWSCVERFRSSEREDATAEANRRFASPGVEAVRVIRETFDANEQVFKQRTIFRNAKPNTEVPAFSAGAKPAASGPRRGVLAPTAPARPAPRAGVAAPAKPPPRAEAAPRREPPPDSAKKPKPEKPKKARKISFGGMAEPAALRAVYAMVRPLVIPTVVGLILSLAVFAALFTESAGRLVLQLSDDLGVNPERVAYGSIVAAFVVSFLVALYLFAGAQSRASRSLRSVAAGEPAPVVPAAAPPAPAPGESAPEPAELPAEAATPPEPDKAPEKPAEQPAEKKPPAEELTAANAVERETLLRFFADGMKQPNMQAYVSDGKMAPHNRFGCHLYLLGAGRACLAASRAEPAALAPVLQSALELLGTDSERARSFISKEEEYARDPKYKGMIQVGFKAMDRFMAGAAGATAALAQALKAWNTTDADDAQSDNIAIMFTDMVSSVETTQALGDQGMMKLVQTHNLIVGSVLKTHHGHQVKHTGDGIMAVFPKVIDGVAAASEIQRQIAEHNRVTASSFLKVRIGLASGTPIRDQDDYFGTVVQLAARLCPCAGEAEICVSEAIAEQVAPTKRFAFSEVREVKLKGFTQLQSMRFVLWQQARAAAPAA